MRREFVTVFLLYAAGMPAAVTGQQPAYRITAIRYATIDSFPVSALVRGADVSERLDIAMVV